MEPLLNTLVTLAPTIGVAVIAWFTGRSRQKADTRKIEVEVFEKSLQVIQKDVIAPLSTRIAHLQKENEEILKQLNNLKNALSKIYNCRHLAHCPLRNELQKPPDKGGTRGNRENAAHRQRAPDSEDNDQSSDRAPGDGGTDAEPP